jgi:hypothetical protein
MTDLTKSPKKYRNSYIYTEESDVDSLVVEEAFSSNEFQNWLLEKLSEDYKNAKFNGAWKNVMLAYGECDIVIEFLINNKTTVILIEDKIKAPEQPNQAERYHKTGEALVEGKQVDRYITCLLAPRKYFKPGAPMEKYENRISYEDMLEWFEKQTNTDRIQFKKMVLKNAIERKGFQQIFDERTNNFYKYYEKLVRETKPELDYEYNDTYTQGQGWVHIKSTIFLPKTHIKHKTNEGYVDLQIPGIDINEFKEAMETKIENNMSIKQTGKSLSVRIKVPHLPSADTIDSPEMYREDIILALDAAEKLRKWYSDFKNEPIFNKTFKKEST